MMRKIFHLKSNQKSLATQYVLASCRKALKSPHKTSILLMRTRIRNPIPTHTLPNKIHHVDIPELMYNASPSTAWDRKVFNVKYDEAIKNLPSIYITNQHNKVFSKPRATGQLEYFGMILFSARFDVFEFHIFPSSLCAS